MSDVAASFVRIFGDVGDETVKDYIVGVLEDDALEWGERGEGAFEAIGDFLVDGEFVSDSTSAKEACAKLATALCKGGETRLADFRALESGPMRLADDPGVTVVDDVDVRHLLENPLGNAVPELQEKDRAKLEKRQMKEERQQRAAMAARQAEMEAAMVDTLPTIKRDRTGGAVGNLKLEDFSVSNGGKELIQNGELLLASGRRYGLVGRNGTGKTTLLRALAQKEIKGIPPNCQVVHVEQETRGDETTVIDAILQCDVERTELLDEERQLTSSIEQSGDRDGTLGAQLKRVYDRLGDIDADHAESRAASILAGLSFTPEMQRYQTKQLSGGWRMRAALARALFIEPDVLLLDEPTNHLDLHAVLWLEECLQKWPKTLLIVSHARHFLNSVCTDIVHLHSYRLITYKGDFDTFERTMRDRLMQEQKHVEAQEKQRKHIQAFIDKFRYNAKRASLVQSRIKALERMAEIQNIERDPEYMFRFPDPGPITGNVVRFLDVDFAYTHGPTLFRRLHFGIDADSRFAIVGSNGIGKSTLLHLIQGALEATRGHIERNPRARFAIFSQHHVDGLDLALNPLQYLARQFPSVKEQELRSHLGSFGICGGLALQAMYTLSGGQKSRVALAKVTWCKPNVLLLDEPSNHLDMDAVDALIEGLALFKGAVLMVSHDQYLIESTVDELWMCENGEVTVFHGTFQEYKERLRKKA